MSVRRTYRNHLLREHGQVIRGGTSTPVRLEGRELENVRAADNSRLREASHRREALGLPRVTDQEAARRLHDNRARRARRSRAVARAQAYVQQRAARQRVARPQRMAADVFPLLRAATPPPTLDAVYPSVVSPVAERHTILVGCHPTSRLSSPTARTYTPCGRCIHCPCRQPQELSEAQRVYPPLRHFRPTSRQRTPSPKPPQLWPEEPTGQEETMSLGSGGSPVDFLDTATYEAILDSFREDPGQTPAFSGSPPGTPPQLARETLPVTDNSDRGHLLPRKGHDDLCGCDPHRHSSIQPPTPMDVSHTDDHHRHR